MQMQTNVQIQTPEQVRVTYETAGIGSRALAQLVDLVILAVFYTIFSVAVGLSAGFNLFGDATSWVIAISLIMGFLVFWSYFIVTEYFFSGKSIGKWVCRLRVVRQDGRPLTFFGAVVRNLIRIVDFLPSGYLLGLAVMLFSKHERRLGDMVAGTVVVKDRARTYLQVISDDEEVERSAFEPIVLPLTVGKGKRKVGLFTISQPLSVDVRQKLDEVIERFGSSSPTTQRLLIERMWTKLLEDPATQLDVPDDTMPSMNIETDLKGFIRLLRAIHRAVRNQERRLQKS